MESLFNADELKKLVGCLPPAASIAISLPMPAGRLQLMDNYSAAFKGFSQMFREQVWLKLEAID